MRLIIAGSRSITDHDFVAAKLSQITANTRDDIEYVVSGGARGVDLIGESWANGEDIPVRRFVPDWKRYGRSAGYRRNVEMAEVGTHLIAFWDGESRGTKHMIDIARDKGLETRIVRVS